MRDQRASGHCNHSPSLNFLCNNIRRRGRLFFPPQFYLLISFVQAWTYETKDCRVTAEPADERILLSSSNFSLYLKRRGMKVKVRQSSFYKSNWLPPCFVKLRHISVARRSFTQSVCSLAALSALSKSLEAAFRPCSEQNSFWSSAKVNRSLQYKYPNQEDILPSYSLYRMKFS